jgi:predicted 2-oxoglutarate/Fe(II)-dependent dioxygenase YbiX
VFPEIERAFQARMASFELPRVGCYESAAQRFFGRHRDNRTAHTAHRLFAVTVNLNTGTYEGGQLRFPEFGRQLYQPGPGGAVVFSCSLLHEALPVTSGRRFDLFSFFTDAAGAKREQELIAREKAKGHRGVQQT